jgi:hypothetical protein
MFLFVTIAAVFVLSACSFHIQKSPHRGRLFMSVTELDGRYMDGQKPYVDIRQLQRAQERALAEDNIGDGVGLVTEGAAVKWPNINFDVPTTKSELMRTFLSHPTAQLIIIMTLGLLSLRLHSFPLFRTVDLWVMSGTYVFWTVQEWILHKYLLHKRLLPTEEGWVGYQIHKGHHSLPYYHVSLDEPEIAVVWGAAITLLVNVLAPGEAMSTLRLDFLVTYFSMGLLYEWTHYMAHTKYKPTSALGRLIKSHHMTHHLDDNRCKFAFTVPLLDEFFGTNEPLRPRVLRKNNNEYVNKDDDTKVSVNDDADTIV